MPKVGRRSDHALHDYLRKDNRVQANAPFGTFYTPNIRMKIVGGRPVQVVEGELMPQEMCDTPVPRARLPFFTRPLNPIQCTQPPQSVNPTPRATFASPEVTQPDPRLNAGYSTAQADRYNSHLHQQPLNPHSVLPPISTRSPPPEAAPIHAYHTHEVTSDPLSESPRLYRLLPRDTYLPREPLFLKRDEELQLSRILRDEMSKVNPNKVKDVYMDLLGLDRNMTCYVSYQDLSLAFTKNQVHIPPQLLRLIAALYVSTREYGLVNYEKLITFIGGAAKMAGRDQSPPGYRQSSPPFHNSKQSNNNSPSESLQDRPNYYNHPDSPSPGERGSSPRRSPVRDRDDAKLVRLIEQQFLAAPDRVDIDKIRSVFAEADRTHRGTLSKQQIKQVALLCRLPLQDAILDRIIERCEDRGLGQFDWIQFVEFIERIQPASTGLRIPTSKKPREFAKHYPTPGSNWPRAEGASDSPRQRSPEKSQHYNTLQYNIPRVNFDHDKNQLNSMEKEIRKLEEQYLEMKDKMLHEPRYGPKGQDIPQPKPAEKAGRDINDKPWFDRFLKLVEGLYKNDVDNNGRLRADEVKWLTNEYDNAYNLHLPAELKEEALQRAVHDGNKVELATFVKFLGMANP
ncbi:uncharacterized protein LOC135486339 isoform X2 [Lineus longissimus]|uniref:uncharacterized protein LOC135486339 isoform X2 n=1 Tax=Lineus longissimus TaxID=88925 RepID=UPI00315D6BAD